MQLLWISIICLTVGIAKGGFCPNGISCNGVCCPRFLYGGSYDCCISGCRIVGGCYLTPERAQLEDSIVDRDIFFPPPEPKFVLRGEESSEELSEPQRGWIKDIIKKFISADIPNPRRKIVATDPQKGWLKDIVKKVIPADIPASQRISEPRMGWIKDIIKKFISADTPNRLRS